MSKATRVGASALAGAVVAALAMLKTPWQAAVLLFWVVAAISWVVPTWITVLPLKAPEVSRRATRQDPRGATADALLLGASLGALGAVVLGILKAADSHGGSKVLLLGAGIGAIVASWSVVHTVFTLRYADLYYRNKSDGIDFNEKDAPVYADFAYLAFTIGMTYQVSDTDITSKTMRHTALRHALMSYLLGTVVIAATINIAAGLAK